jgi:glycosyltransferase involved in cell wall biosynthesis
MSEGADIEIFMPFYGDPGLLREAVESVLAQDDDAWRLVVVDDCYPDPAAGEWVATMADPRVSYVRNDVNLGVSGTFQRCLDLSTASWLTIMGCDDRLRPGYVSRVRALIADHPDVQYVQPGVVVIDDAGRPSTPLPDRIKDRYRPAIDGPTELGGEALVRSLARGNWTYFPSICWRRDAVAEVGFRPELEVVLDLALQLALLLERGTMVLDGEPVFEYRRHAKSVSSWTAADGTRFAEEKALLLRTAQAAHALGWRRAARAARWHLSSRLNAATRLPAALRSMRPAALDPLLRHIFTNRAHRPAQR